MSPRHHNVRRVLKPVLGIGLLALLLSQLDSARLKETVTQVQWGWAALSLVLAILANVACAYRWRGITHALSEQKILSPQSAIELYFQGVAANTVLPGGIIGGDIWRTVGLSKKGISKLIAAKTVFLDRVSGFWALSIFAATVFFVALLTRASSGISIDTLQAPKDLIIGYGVAMTLIVVAPIGATLIAQRYAAHEGGSLIRSLPLSLLSQLLTIAAFGGCLLAVNATINPFMLFLVSAGIFLGAVVPASIGGFGSREVAAVFFLAALSVAPETAFVASFLFGLTATVQGAIVAPILVFKPRS